MARPTPSPIQAQSSCTRGDAGPRRPAAGKGTICAGPACDNQILRELFDYTLQAAQIVGDSEGFRGQLKDYRSRLMPDQVGSWGQLQEWLLEDKDSPDEGHRHLSHLYAMYPGTSITKRGTPELYQAALKSLDARGDGGTGWTSAWKVALRARTEDGNFFDLDPSLSRNGAEPEQFQGEGSEVIVAETLKFIDSVKGSGKPFLTVIRFGSPHKPHKALQKDKDLYKHLPAAFQNYFGEITAMDRAMGNLREGLRARGLDQNTLIWYTSDNEWCVSTRGVNHESGCRIPGRVVCHSRWRAETDLMRNDCGWTKEVGR